MAPTDLSTPDDPALYVIAAEIVPKGRHAMVHNRPDWVMARVISFLARGAV